MKPYKKLLVMAIILVAILILIAFQIEGTKLKDNIMNSESGNQYLNSSGSWYLTGSYVIDGNDGWATFASTYDWCSGSGTWADPYIIENVTFDGLNTGTCLTIQDTNKYFVIKNCSILNTPYTWDDEAGVKLINVKNGTFLRNNFKSNEYRGLYLQLYCNNITIKENFFIGVCYYDIYFVNNLK